jgi:hypothetical protein
VTTTYAASAAVTVDARAVLNAAQHAQLAEGQYAGRWLPLAAVALG